MEAKLAQSAYYANSASSNLSGYLPLFNKIASHNPFSIEVLELPLYLECLSSLLTGLPASSPTLPSQSSLQMGADESFHTTNLTFTGWASLMV